MGEAPDRFNNCVDGSAAGGPYSDADTYTQEITICEDVTYTFKIECCWHTGYFYLELDGTRFRENEPGESYYPSIEFTSLVTTFFITGELAFDGITYDTALANEAVFVAAIAWMCDVEEAAVSVTISRAAQRLVEAGRRLDDHISGEEFCEQSGLTETECRSYDSAACKCNWNGGQCWYGGEGSCERRVKVAYDVAVEDGGDVMTIIDRVEGYTAAEIDATFILVADDAGVADVFETLVTTEAGSPTFTDPFGPYSFSYKYTMPPTLSRAPSLSPAPSNPWTALPSMTPAPTVTFAPTLSPYEYQPVADTTSYCQLHDVSVCWGNTRRFMKVLDHRPFDIAWPDSFRGFNVAFGDIDGDDDLDLVVGDRDGRLYFFRNVGSVLKPEFVGPKTGRGNPFDGIDMGKSAAPVLADLDGDGRKLCPSFDEPPTHSARRRPGPNRRRK